MQRSAVGASLGLVIALAAPAVARADVATLYGQIGGGFAGGKGLSGGAKDAAFHEGAKGGAYGFLVGAEALFIDAWVEHEQYRDGGLVGTWTQLMVGLDVEIDLGDAKGGSINDKGAREGGYASSFISVGTGLGVGFGTGQQVEPPLDNAEVTDKGFVAQGTVAFGYRLTKLLSIGVSVPIRAGFLIKNDVPANDPDASYIEASAAAMLNLKLNLSIK